MLSITVSTQFERFKAERLYLFYLFIYFFLFLFLNMITLEMLNQSEPKFHT